MLERAQLILDTFLAAEKNFLAIETGNLMVRSRDDFSMARQSK